MNDQSSNINFFDWALLDLLGLGNWDLRFFMPLWRNWETRVTQNHVGLKLRVGSTPTSGKQTHLNKPIGASGGIGPPPLKLRRSSRLETESRRDGGIGRHVRFRVVWVKPWGFESPSRQFEKWRFTCPSKPEGRRRKSSLAQDYLRHRIYTQFEMLIHKNYLLTKARNNDSIKTSLSSSKGLRL